jgi:transposase
MTQQSITQISSSKAASQVRRRWQEAFRQRMQGIALEAWRCVGVDIGKYEHVAVVTDGWGSLLVNPFRFSLRQRDVNHFLAQVEQVAANHSPPLVAMEPTGHYYEPLAYEVSQRHGLEQVFLVQSYDVAERRKTWNKGTFKNDEVDACIIAQVLREGHGRPYRPPSGVYLTLYHLERYRLAREQAATRLKNQIIGHVDRLYPGLVVRDRDVAQRLKPMFRDMWTMETPRRLLELCPDPYQLRQQTADSLYQQFRAAGYWMNRPYAGRILAAAQTLCLPNPELVTVRAAILQLDLRSLAVAEQQVTETEAEMVSHLDETWGFWLRPTGVDPARLACLVAAVGDISPYESARQLFGRSGLHVGCNDSGIRQQRGQGQHIIKPGDRHLRRQLLRFTFSMLARYPALRAYKGQCQQRGLSQIAARIAVARKLTGIIFSLATRSLPFEPERLA